MAYLDFDKPSLDKKVKTFPHFLLILFKLVASCSEGILRFVQRFQSDAA